MNLIGDQLLLFDLRPYVSLELHRYAINLCMASFSRGGCAECINQHDRLLGGVAVRSCWGGYVTPYLITVPSAESFEYLFNYSTPYAPRLRYFPTVNEIREDVSPKLTFRSLENAYQGDGDLFCDLYLLSFHQLKFYGVLLCRGF